MSFLCGWSPHIFKAQILPLILGEIPHICSQEEAIERYVSEYVESSNISWDTIDANPCSFGEHDNVFQKYMNSVIYIDDNINVELTEIVNSLISSEEVIYTPKIGRACGIGKIKINEKIGLVGDIGYQPTITGGITRNGKGIVVYDEYYKKLFHDTETHIETRMLGWMAAWKAEVGIYILSKMNNKMIRIHFNKNKWNDIVNRLKQIDYREKVGEY